jgi:hypothetical protein
MSVKKTIRALALLAMGALQVSLLSAQTHPTANGSLTVQLQNGSGLQMVLYSDPSGVSLGNSGTANATLAFGNVAAYGTLNSNVTRSNGTNSFTVSTPFDVNVQVSGIASTSYTLSASLASAAPTGVTLQVDSVSLSTSSQSVQTNGTYGSNVSHTLSAVILTAASGSGGPTTGTQLTSTINFVATAN